MTGRCDFCLPDAPVRPVAWAMTHVSGDGDEGGPVLMCTEHAIEVITADLTNPDGHVHNPDGTSAFAVRRWV